MYKMTISRRDAKKTRICKVCRQEKPITEYYKHPTCEGGHLHACKICRINYARQYRKLHYIKKERKPLGVCVKCGGAERYKNGDCMNCARDRASKYRLDNPKASNEWRKNHPGYQANWKKENPERIIEYRRAFNLAVPGRTASYSQNYKATKRKNGGSYTPDEWNAMIEKYGGHCLACGKITKLAADHVKPVSLGGLNIIDNIQPLCKSCNSKKKQDEIDYRILWGEV
jgi:5-methylcytosine-specific restriction endonuclease McrA